MNVSVRVRVGGPWWRPTCFFFRFPIGGGADLKKELDQAAAILAQRIEAEQNAQ